MLRNVTCMFCVFSIVALSCSNPAAGGGDSGGLSGEKIFWAQKITDNSWYQIGANKIASGANIEVYADTTAGVSTATGQAIVTEYESNIHNLMLTNFGTNLDVDGNGKITLLLLNIIDGYSGSGGYVAGYFDATHEYSTATYAKSNQKDMLFMDTYPAVPGSTSFYQTIAHELQHLISFSYAQNNFLTAQDTWINEGLSTGAEYLYDPLDSSRVDYYNDIAHGTTTTMRGNNFYIWDGYWEQNYPYDVLADYSTAYLFFQWLRIHASNGTAIYKDILQSSFRGYQAVTAAANLRINGSFSSWDTLLSTWLLANYRNEPTGFKGYLNLVTTTPHRIISNGLTSPWAFSPGEGFVKQVSGASFTDPGSGGSNIKYIGITDATGVLDTSGTVYGGESLLVYNNSTTTVDVTQNGTLPTSSFVAGSLMSMIIFPATLPAPSSYPISVNLTPGGGLDPQSHKVQPQDSLFSLSKNAKK